MQRKEGVSLGYLPELDGLRAAAIGLVVVNHIVPHASGGSLGIDVFFTLSGFLITSLLVGERQSSGCVDVRNFYVRRALRLIPALLLFIVLVSTIQAIDPVTEIDFGRVLPIVLLYCTNWSLAFVHLPLGYFSQLWTLAIEEQFYLTWPWVLRRWASVPDLARTLLLLAITVAAARTVLGILNVRIFDVVTPLRADGLLAGAALAILVYRDNQLGRLERLGSTRAAMGFIAILTAAAIAISATHSAIRDVRSVAIAAAGLATVGIIGHVLVADVKAPLRRFLRWGPVVAVGRVSYGIYLFHFPLIDWFGHRHWSTLFRLTCQVLATPVVVAGSWFLVERPALKLKRRFESDRAASPVVA